MTRTLTGLLFAFFVVTATGQRVAGPFTLLSDCSDVAKMMARRDPMISPICQWFL